MSTAVTIDDFRALARRRLPRVLFDYIDGGAYAEETLARNVRDFQTLALRQRVLADVSALSLSTELFGQTLGMPVALGPVGFAGMYARRGEVQAARAAERQGVPFCLSTVGICAIEELRRNVETPPWYQLYMIRDRGYMRELLARVQAAGAPVLVFTVDLPVPGARYREARNAAAGRLAQAWDGLGHPRWFWDVYLNGRPHNFGNIASAVTDGQSMAHYWNWIRANFDPSVTWRDLEWVRQSWQGPIVIKGILDPEDARQARALGAEGVIVSNHGGRQLDGVLSSIAALPRIVDAVGDDLAVLMDGGVRSGLDVLKALALGARACLLGRAWAFALAAGGEAGVASMLEHLRQELEVAMALTGCTDLRQAGRHLLDAA
ncbi:L-lactate dehydrogenase [Parapedomonas caeni]|jgi:L-lactate dehydrogenase (cytochrome)